MSNFLAIATATAALRRLLLATIPSDVAGADATTLRPDASTTTLPDIGVNIYLYQVTPNAQWRNADLPTRSQRGEVVQRPRIGLDLHYLFTFYGDEAQLEPQRVLGSVMRTLHARPYLTHEAIENTTIDPTFPFLADSDLADEVELVKFTPIPFTLEELSKLWSVLFQTPYTLSVAFIGTVVLIEAEDTPQRALPVRVRGISAVPFQHSEIDRIIRADGELDDPIEMGDTAALQGSQLDGEIEEIRVGVASLQPVPQSVSPDEIRIVLNDPALRAGVQGVQVVYTNDNESNVAALVLRPLITVDQPSVTATAVPIAFGPAVSRVQRVVLFLNERNPPTTRRPRAYSFDAPTNNGITVPNVDETTDITFQIADVAPGDYLARVQVAGAENRLELGIVDGTEQYAVPMVTIP